MAWDSRLEVNESLQLLGKDYISWAWERLIWPTTYSRRLKPTSGTVRNTSSTKSLNLSSLSLVRVTYSIATSSTISTSIATKSSKILNQSALYNHIQNDCEYCTIASNAEEVSSFLPVWTVYLLHYQMFLC